MTKSKGEHVFNIINIFILVLLGFSCLFPFVHVLSKSLSSETAIISGKVFVLPVKFNIYAYRAAMLNIGLMTSLKFTAVLTVLGTATNIILTIIAAYPLTKRNLTGRRIIWIFILITMFINGGLIPTYLLVKSLGLIDNIWALILPGAISTYYMIIMKTYFQNLPESLEESARIDGANDILILLRIIIPLSKPVIATLTLFYTVGHWNQFMSALIYMNSPKNFTIQLRLRQLIPTDISLLAMEGQNLLETPFESLKAASVMFATIPILFVYPRIQKYFIKGIMLGAVKG